MYKCVITQTVSAVMAWFSFYRHVCNQCHQASVILSIPRVSFQHMFARFKYREADFQTVFSRELLKALFYYACAPAIAVAGDMDVFRFSDPSV